MGNWRKRGNEFPKWNMTLLKFNWIIVLLQPLIYFDVKLLIRFRVHRMTTKGYWNFTSDSPPPLVSTKTAVFQMISRKKRFESIYHLSFNRRWINCRIFKITFYWEHLASKAIDIVLVYAISVSNNFNQMPINMTNE